MLDFRDSPVNQLGQCNASNSNQDTRLLTREEAADYLRVKASTLAIWASTKRYALPFIKVGRSVRYTVKDLERFLEERTVPPSDPKLGPKGTV